MTTFIWEFVLHKTIELYDGYLWTLTFADKRVNDWLLMSSPVYTIGLTMAYLVMVAVGPSIMENFKPLSLRWLLVFYNFLMVVLNLYICVETFVVSWKLGYNYSCQPVNYSDDPLEMRMAAVLWWFYFSKLLEFADTLFFILRKKFNQVSFLHVYHHSTMFCFWWVGIKWVAGGSAFLGAMLNSFVHVMMYSYYMLSAAFPNSYIPWKKSLTTMQLIQFFIAIVQTVRGLIIDCPFPRWMGYTLVVYMVSFIILFLNFWLHAYNKPKEHHHHNHPHHHHAKRESNMCNGVVNGNHSKPCCETSEKNFTASNKEELVKRSTRSSKAT